jgi:hypothetical protein
MSKNKWKSAVFNFSAALALMIAPGTALATSNNGNSNAGDSVTICHATGSASNPYVVIHPNANGVVSGHYDHQDGRDIIPSFTYNDHGTTKTFPGQNLGNGGQAILDNGCVVPQGGQGGGPQVDCDGDTDNSPASECTTPPQPQNDCDGDTDNSPASECTTGGMGGGLAGGGTTTTTTATGQVLGASTTVAAGGLGAGQISVLPQGSVNGGEGAAAMTASRSSMVGLVGSLLLLGSGLVMLNRRNG